MSYTPIICRVIDLMKIHNHGKFHQYNICGCQVNSFQSFKHGFSIHKMVFFGKILCSYSPKYSSILPKFSLEVLANKNIVWKLFEGFDFLWKRDGYKVCIFGPVLTSNFPLKIAKIEKNLYSYGKNLAIGLSKYVKIKVLSTV